MLSSKIVNKDIIHIIIDIFKNSNHFQNIFSHNFNKIIRKENNNRMIKRIFQLIYTLKRMETIRNNSISELNEQILVQ